MPFCGVPFVCGNSHKASFRSKYDVGAKVGMGTFAQVRVCRFKATGEERVVKLISKPHSKADFEFEVSVLKEVGTGECENVVSFYHSFEDARFFYCVMEYCSGGELLDRLDNRETITEEVIANYVSQILRALAYVHSKGFVHRDIKPQNLLFSSKQKDTLKLIDFGLSCRMTSKRLLEDPCGVPEFVAPEIVLGRYGRKVDVWAVGVLCYTLLFGHLPFQADLEQVLFRKIVEDEPSFDLSVDGWRPSSLAIDFCRSLLSKDFRERPTAAEALNHLWILSGGVSLHTEGEDPRPSQVEVPLSVRRAAREQTLIVAKKTVERAQRTLGGFAPPLSPFASQSSCKGPGALNVPATVKQQTRMRGTEGFRDDGNQPLITKGGSATARKSHLALTSETSERDATNLDHPSKGELKLTLGERLKAGWHRTRSGGASASFQQHFLHNEGSSSLRCSAGAVSPSEDAAATAQLPAPSVAPKSPSLELSSQFTLTSRLKSETDPTYTGVRSSMQRYSGVAQEIQLFRHRQRSEASAGLGNLLSAAAVVVEKPERKELGGGGPSKVSTSLLRKNGYFHQSDKGADTEDREVQSGADFA